MSNWMENQMAQNQMIQEEIIPELIQLKQKYPEEKALDKIISTLETGIFNDDYLFKIRSDLRQIIVRREYNFMSSIRDFWNVTEHIYRLENKDKYDKEDCFPLNFDFDQGENYYYFSFPRLKKKFDLGSKTEHMTDQYIQNSIADSLKKYQHGRPKFRKFETYTLIFIHHYLPEQADDFDTDNIDIKKPIDSINGILIDNDTISRSHIFQISKCSDKEYTEMFVIEGHLLSNAILKNLIEIQP